MNNNSLFKNNTNKIYFLFTKENIYEYEYTSRSLPVQNQFVTQQGDPTNLPCDRENCLIFFF